MPETPRANAPRVERVRELVAKARAAIVVAPSPVECGRCARINRLRAGVKIVCLHPVSDDSEPA